MVDSFVPDPTPEQKQRMEELFKKLPPGNQPFVLTREEWAKLDPHTRHAVAEEQLFRQSSMRIAIACPKHKARRCVHCVGGISISDMKSKCSYCKATGEVPYNAPMTFGCAHVAEQDPLKPNGIVFTPKRYYVCFDCWSLIQRKRFDFSQEIMTLCWECISEEAWRIYRIDPNLLLDYVNPKKA